MAKFNSVMDFYEVDTEGFNTDKERLVIADLPVRVLPISGTTLLSMDRLAGTQAYTIFCTTPSLGGREIRPSMIGKWKNKTLNVLSAFDIGDAGKVTEITCAEHS